MGFCCAYFAFMGENLSSVITFWSNCQINIPPKLIIILLLIPIVPMVWVRKLKHYALTNIIADICIVGPLFYIMYLCANQLSEVGVGPNVENFKPATFWPFLGMYG